MYVPLKTFSVATTNIFPLVNSTKGGQLVTEFNLKSRDMVMTNPDIKYAVGPSFTHSEDDFKVSLYGDGDIPASSSILQVSEGRAVINGHYVESLAPMIIDLSVLNTELQQAQKAPLYGDLSIGIRSYFSTESTMMGSMLPESDGNYLGIQLIIAPTADFITPFDSPTNQNNVIADLKLADFTYVQGAVSAISIVQNPDVTRYISSKRVFDFDSILASKYVTSDGLQPDAFYTYSGKYGWCYSDESLMIWDSEPRKTTTPPPTFGNEASFKTDDTGNVYLNIPHKQQHWDVPDEQDPSQRVYYADKKIPLPVADFNRETSGIVTSAYTAQIKRVENIINSYKEFTNGKQIKYIDVLTTDNVEDEFPTDLSDFDIGDYILVRSDNTIYSGSSTEGSAPSTMYFVLPGGVTSIAWNSTEKPSGGVRIGNVLTMWEGTDEPPTEENPTAEELLEDFNYTSYIGTIKDYFELVYRNRPDNSGTSYYYKVSSTGPKTWSGAVLLTGGIPLATEAQRGGFYNVSTDVQDGGYVYLDNTGHLRLVDYQLLRSGTLAYQLGEDQSIASNSTLSYINAFLDENVNSRIAFPFASEAKDELNSTPAMIDVYIPLPIESEGTINIYDIDSRFGTGVYLHFMTESTSEDYSGIVINIINCEKVRIDSSVTAFLNSSNGPIINVVRSCLYYDSSVIDYIRLCDVNGVRTSISSDFTGFTDLTLWYTRFKTNDPDLIVNGMEISSPNVAMATQDIEFWSETIPDDNHYSCALRSITLSGDGEIIACSLYVSNNTSATAPITTTRHIIIGGDFVLPQGSELNYPATCINSPLKVTGTFTTAYRASVGANWIVSETSFTALTGVYSDNTGEVADGSIVFNTSTSLIESPYIHSDSIGAWAPNSYHIFYGGTTVGGS